MKHIKRTMRPATTLQLNKETIRTLRVLPGADLGEIVGGMMHTSFSCGANLCTTHGG